MYKVVERVRCKVKDLEDEISPQREANGYMLEDGLTVVEVYDGWKVSGSDNMYVPVINAEKIIGFERLQPVDPKVELFCEENELYEAELVGIWEGYNVYSPYFKNERKTGVPIWIMEKDGEVRFSTREEAIIIFNALCEPIKDI